MAALEVSESEIGDEMLGHVSGCCCCMRDRCGKHFESTVGLSSAVNATW